MISRSIGSKIDAIDLEIIELASIVIAKNLNTHRIFSYSLELFIDFSCQHALSRVMICKALFTSGKSRETSCVSLHWNELTLLIVLHVKIMKNV